MRGGMRVLAVSDIEEPELFDNKLRNLFKGFVFKKSVVNNAVSAQKDVRKA